MPCLAASVGGETIDFNRDVRPILSHNCFQCHGPDEEKREADLRLDVEDAAKADRGGYPVLAPGDPEASELIARISAEDPDYRMPPAETGKQLTGREIAVLTRWIEQGADWADHWAYVRPARHPVPISDDDNWARNWIDRFIANRLQHEGLGPSSDADPVTLIRRLYFDLTGLPPMPDEVDSFVRDESYLAYERRVNQLLHSPRFGERMAMVWLDLVRYADTVGYHGDQDHHISPYRDYVIDAFNGNMPFDRFTREQLAGDLLPDPTVDQRIATGYNRLLQTSHEGGVQPKEYLSIYAADRVRNVSAVWLGGTLGCAQCHDHKFDPYTSKDFYAMASFFADIDEEGHFTKGADRVPTVRPPEIDVLDRRDRQRLAQLLNQLAALREQVDGERPNERLQEQIAELETARKRIERRRRRTMVTVSLPTPRVVRVLPRGNWLDDSGPAVLPAVPTFLGRRPAGQRANRLDLASWLTDPRDGVGLLTARVMVNRFWYLCFGVGLCPSLDDFGSQGKPPVHPELLDNLAVEFVESGWDVKHIIRLLVTSRTYRQSSQASEPLRRDDPQNLLFARQSRFRLPAEMVRDMALSVSGLLVGQVGGPSVKPYQPSGYYRHLNFPRRRYAYHADGRQWRRGVYVHWQRQFLHPMLKAFDAPSREECTVARPRSNTPLAALVLLNDPSFVEAARGLAQRALSHEGPDDEQRLSFAFRAVTTREPDSAELAELRALLDWSREEYRQDGRAAASLLNIGERSPDSRFEPSELAAWTSTSRAILNLSEATTRR